MTLLDTEESQVLQPSTLMTPELAILLQRAREVRMTPAEREVQRMNFAYGNAHLENDAITREVVRRAIQRLQRAKA